MKQMHESMLQAVRNGNSGEKKRGGNSISSTTNELLREEYEEKLGQKSSEISKLKEKVKEEQYKYENLTLQLESKEIEQERKVQDLQLDKRNLENQIKRLQS